MNQKVFSVFDQKAGAYLRPFVADTAGLAERSFLQACRDPEHEFAKHSEDFTLVELGEFNPLTGELHSLPMVRTVLTALQARALKVS